MTSNDSAIASAPGWVLAIRGKLDPLLPPSRREALQRVVSALVIALLGTGVLTADKAVLWTQLGLSAVALLFALLYAGTSVRATLYSFIVVVASVVQAYGIAQGVDWAIIVSSVAQAFGVTTAAAKAQPPSG